MRKVPPPTVLFFVALLIGRMAFSQVVVSEVHYHPIEEAAFKPDGTPLLDLTEDVHEFVEIQNTSAAAVDLTGWQLSGGIDFTFPAGTMIQAGGYRVVAKDPSRLAAVYNLNSGAVLGPYTGKLSNNGDTVRVRDAQGATIDAVNYLPTFPWAGSPDALGAGKDFLGYNALAAPYNAQYKGRSLQRVSTTASSNDPANWVASPWPGTPSPGAANASTRAVPKPVISAFSVVQASDEAGIIRAGQQVRITCTFTSVNAVSDVQVEYWLDNIEQYAETKTSVSMTSLGNGQYSAVLPGQANRSVVRFRFRADLGEPAGVETVSPRADDVATVPYTATSREAWHSYFVSPVRTSTSPAYDFFISSASVTELNTNISQNPRRIVSPDPPGYPRDEPFTGYYPGNNNFNPANYPAPGAPEWNGVVPAIFVSGGVVYDVNARYHGSRYQRSAGKNSWKISFRNSYLFEGKQRMLLTEKGADNVLGYTLFREAGLLAASSRFIDFYKNNDGMTRRCEISDNDEETIRRYQAELIARSPQTPPEFQGLGVIYKSKGLDGDEGPYGWANGQPMPPRSPWSILDRYVWAYPIQNSDWKGHAPFQSMLNALWTARGDRNQVGYSTTYAGQNHNNQVPVNVNLNALRSYLNANWDVDRTLTYLAIRNWMSPWDDKFHNYLVYHQPDGKWTMLPWDFDFEMQGTDGNTSAPTNSIFAGRKNDSAGSYSNNSRGPNWFKDSMLRAFETEYKQRLFTLNNTFLSPASIQALCAELGISAPSSQWLTDRFNSVNSQCGLGVFQQPSKPVNVSPADTASALPPTALQASAYSHSNSSTPSPHTSTRWEIRAANGGYREPVFVVTSTTNLTSLPIPFEQLTFGTAYFWRCTYFDAQGHPSLTSDETQFVFGQAPVTKTLVNIDDVTQWRYNQTANLDGTNWTAPEYDDSSWPSGAALLYVENSAVPEAKRTPLTIGRNTYYFRTRFNFTGGLQGTTLRLRHIVDDGLVVYLNGVEVWRIGMPAGAINYGTASSRTVGEAVYEPDSGWFEIPSTALVAGENVIAVEVHQINLSSSDVVFGLQLEADVPNLSGDLVINEVMADNRSAVVNGGKNPDWVELYNASLSPVDLSGMSLSDDVLKPGKFVFPQGTTIPALGYLVVWCDSNTLAPGLHTGFGLAKAGQTIALFSGQTVKDSLTFGPQVTDHSISRVANGSGGFTLTVPTPGATNAAATPLGAAASLKINEWMAAPLSGEDWFEIYNADERPVALGGLYLSDSTTSPTLTQIPPHSFVAAGGFVRFDADGTTAGANHANFKLSTGGESLVLTAANGVTTIDTISFGAQQNGVSQGRFLDGSATLVSFPQTPTPEESNYLLAPVFINEALTNSISPLEDAVELHNPGTAPVDIGRWWLSDDPRNLKKYQIAAGTSVAPGGYHVLYENQFNPVPGQGNSFSLSSTGEELFLSAADAAGNLTGYRTRVKFGGAADGVSFGRIVNGNGADFFPQIARTFGQDTPGTVAEFRTGVGLANSGPKIGPVIINEVMYHPPDLAALDNVRDEFIELHNISTSSQSLGGWALKDAVDFTFPGNAAILPGDYILVVGFDPANTATLEAFRTAHGVSASVPVYGPFSPKLPNSLATVELAYPGAAVNGEIPEILVDRVRYSDVAPWPGAPDGDGPSLQRISRVIYGNDPSNWSSGAATPGGVNAGQQAITDSDGDGMPDVWELANGFDPKSGADAAQDKDGDGQSNAQEFVAGTSPADGLDAFRSEVVSGATGGFTVRFTAKAGKDYTIQYRNDLQVGSWLKLSDVAPADADRTVEVNDSAASGRRFYRVVTPAAP